jgi:NADH-quinone oxidoreductase subunit K
MIPLENYLVLSAILFAVGTLGVLVRRNAIVIFMSVELMLNAVNIAMAATSSYTVAAAAARGQAGVGYDGQIFVFFIMAVAAAEAAVGLAIMITFFRRKHTIDVEEMNLMKG